jgi:hypothetical protein
MLHYMVGAFIATLVASTAITAPNSSMTNPSAATASGTASQGYSTSLSVDSPDLRLGAPVWATLEIRNVSGKVQYTTFSDRHYGYDFTVVNVATNKEAKRNPNSNFGLDAFSGRFKGRPVPAHFLKYLHFQLDDLYIMKEPGAYRIQCKAARIAIDGRPVTLPPSNTIVIHLN